MATQVRYIGGRVVLSTQALERPAIEVRVEGRRIVAPGPLAVMVGAVTALAGAVGETVMTNDPIDSVFVQLGAFAVAMFVAVMMLRRSDARDKGAAEELRQQYEERIEAEKARADAEKARADALQDYLYNIPPGKKGPR